MCLSSHFFFLEALDLTIVVGDILFYLCINAAVDL